MKESILESEIRKRSHPIINGDGDFDPLLDAIGDKSIVLLGEATHGSHEFYDLRAKITRRLIREKGFSAIAIEGDWPDAVHLNRFVKSRSNYADAVGSLARFQRFPMWMWRNREFLKLVEWLGLHNRRETTEQQVGVYGIDLYSLYTSIHEVIQYLEAHEPEAAERARNLYSCFDHYNQDPIRYGRFVRVGAQSSCEEQAIEVATKLFKASLGEQSEEHFFASQNARLVQNAEKYYRNIFSPVVNTWNIRDRHMADTVQALRAHLQKESSPGKVIVWAHNSHVGDDRATEMGRRGQWNIGQLLRQEFPDETFNLGFTTYAGTVMAASEWDHPPELKTVQPALEESFEALFHRANPSNFLLMLNGGNRIAELNEKRLERAIGVIYSPETERLSHYFEARINDQFDAVIHCDKTKAVEPLDRFAVPDIERPSEIQF